MAEQQGVLDENVVRARAAFEELAPALEALQPEALLRVNLDVTKAVGTVMLKWPGIRALRPEVEKHLPFFDLARFDRLETLALALFYAQSAFLVAAAPRRTLEELNGRALQLRRIFLADASTQAERKVFEEAVLRRIREGSGYQDLCQDLLALVTLYRSKWSELDGVVAIRTAELDEAEALSAQLLLAAEARNTPQVTRTKASDDRDRAFTLLVEAYNDARRAIRYLRPEVEAEAIAPSLYAGRRGKSGEAELPEPSESPVTVRPADIAPSQAGAPFAVSAGLGGAVDPAMTKVGMPDSNPFTE